MRKRQSISLALSAAAGLWLLAMLVADQQVAARRQGRNAWLDALNVRVCGRRLARPPKKFRQLEEELASSNQQDDDYGGEADSEEEAEYVRGGRNASTRMSAGRPAWPGEFPWFVELQFQVPLMGAKVYYCGGVLIHNNLVLTAAHCVLDSAGRPVKELLLVGGLTHLVTSPARQTLTAEAVEVHPNYNPAQWETDKASGWQLLPKLRSDIAVVKTSYPFYYNDYIQPACLTDQNIDRFLSPTCEVAGFGMTSSKPPTQPNKLLTMSLRACRPPLPPMAADEKCLTAARPLEQKGRPCPGDSGSPLLCADNYQLGDKALFFVTGLVSNGPQGCEPGQTEFTRFANVLLHLDDIINLARKLTLRPASRRRHRHRKRRPSRRAASTDERH